MKNAFAEQLATLRASKDDLDKDQAEHAAKTYKDAIENHHYLPRKVIYGNGNSVQYEFLCPVSRGIMMIYKGPATFKGYDFTNRHPNPRLRELVKTDSSLADTHGFAAE